MSVRELEKEDVLFREQIAGPRQPVDGDVAVHDQQADASIFTSGFRRVDRQEVHAPYARSRHTRASVPISLSSGRLS